MEICGVKVAISRKIRVKMRLSSFQENRKVLLAENKLADDDPIHIQSSWNERIRVERHSYGDIMCESLSYPMFKTSSQAILNE